jgi:iron complex outermembrane receptor protein
MLTSAALAAMLTSPVLAQRASEQLPPLVVDSDAVRDDSKGYVVRRTDTATKTDTPLLKLPRSVSTVTAKEVEDRGAQTVQEALNYTAGVSTYFRQGNLTREYNRVRGFEAFQFLDGLKLHDSSWGYEVYGLERIDVLKGPASTLYGQGSPGGLINLTSKRPTDTPFREFMLRTGSYGRLEGGFDVGGPVNADKSVLYRLVGLGRFGDGQIDYTRNERVYFAPSVTVRNDQTSLTILAHYQYDPKLTVLQPLPRVGTILPGANGQYISRKLFLGEPAYHNTSKETARIGYEFNHRFNEVFSFQQNLAYQNIDIQLKEVQSRGALVGNSVVRQMTYQPYQIDLFQVDNRLKADFNTGPFRHHMLFGVDYSLSPNDQGTAVNRASQYLLNLYNPVYGQPLAANSLTQKRYQVQRQTGIYVQDRIEVGGFTVIGGVRGDWASLDQKTKVLNTVTSQFSEPDWTPKRDRATTVHGGLIYAFQSGVAPYVSYSESFAPVSGADVTGKPFDPSTGEQIEAGIRYLPPHLNLLVSGAVFDITQRNLLTADLKNPGFAVQTQEIRARGAEIEFKTTNLHGFNVVAGYTYLDPTVTRTNTAGGVGKDPAGMARHQASLWGTYTFDDATTLKGLTVGGGVRYVGASFGDALNTFAVPSFTLFDATLRYQLGVLTASLAGWDVSINAKNIADKRYVGVCEDALNCYYGAGRIIEGAVRVRF